MTFDDLLNIKMPEAEIFDRAAEILQKNFLKYQDVYVCLELGAAEGESSKAICFVRAIRFYKNNSWADQRARSVFMYHGEYEKVYLITRFMEGCYRTTLMGHFIFRKGDIYKDQINETHNFKNEEDIIKDKLIPPEIVLGAFNEFSDAIISTRKKQSA
jgi:hypothetical protein